MNNDLISREYIKLFSCEYEKFNGKEVEIVKAVPIQAIDNAPTVEPENERALDLIDSLKDRDAINNKERGVLRRAILLNENTRPQGEWITVHFEANELNAPEKSMLDFVKCPFCETIHQGRHNFCSRCGADMREDSDK